MDSVTSCYNRSLPIDWDSVKADPAGAKEILHIIFAINTTSLEMHLIRLDLQSALMYDSLMVFSYGVCYVLHHILPGYQPYIFMFCIIYFQGINLIFFMFCIIIYFQDIGRFSYKHFLSLILRIAKTNLEIA